jgi:glycerophosphoryl diester phosphodiesterase
VYAPNYAVVTRELVRDYHAAGLRVLPWTVNDAAAMCDLMDLGVDGIISDDPGLLVRTAARCR